MLGGVDGGGVGHGEGLEDVCGAWEIKRALSAVGAFYVSPATLSQTNRRDTILEVIGTIAFLIG